MGNRWVAVLDKWLDYGVLETILLYKLGFGCNRDPGGGAYYSHAILSAQVRTISMAVSCMYVHSLQKRKPMHIKFPKAKEGT